MKLNSNRGADEARVALALALRVDEREPSDPVSDPLPLLSSEAATRSFHAGVAFPSPLVLTLCVPLGAALDSGPGGVGVGAFFSA